MGTSITLTEKQLALVAGAIDERLQALMAQTVDTMIRGWAAPIAVTATMEAANYSTRLDRLAVEYIDLSAALRALRGNPEGAFVVDRAWFDGRALYEARSTVASMQGRGEALTDRQREEVQLVWGSPMSHRSPRWLTQEPWHRVPPMLLGRADEVIE